MIGDTNTLNNNLTFEPFLNISMRKLEWIPIVQI